MKAKINLKLPEWAWLYSDNGMEDVLKGRDVLLHVRSASVIEFLLADSVGELVHGNFKLFEMPKYLGGEKMIAFSYYMNADESEFDEEIIDKAISFFIKWSANEDRRAIEELEAEYLAKNN